MPLRRFFSANEGERFCVVSLQIKYLDVEHNRPSDGEGDADLPGVFLLCLPPLIYPDKHLHPVSMVIRFICDDSSAHCCRETRLTSQQGDGIQTNTSNTSSSTEVLSFRLQRKKKTQPHLHQLFLSCFLFCSVLFFDPGSHQTSSTLRSSS